MLEKLKSRKLWAGVAGTALAYLLSQLGIPADTIAIIVTPITAFILGQAAVDAAAAKK